MWLSCQQRCDTLQNQMSLWLQTEKEMKRKCGAAEEEVTQLRKALEELHQETAELRRERS